MIFDAPIAERTEELIAPIREGWERARTSGQPVLVSAVRPLSRSLQPIDTFAAKGRPGGDRTFWSRPEEGFSLVGLGAAATLAYDGGRSLGQAAQRYRSLLDTAVIDAPADRGVGPIFMGAFGFDPTAPKSPGWRGFPDALLVLPRFLFTWSGSKRWLTTNFLVRPDANADDEAKAAVAQLEALVAGPSYEVRQPSVLRQSETAWDEWDWWVRQAMQAIEDGRLTKVVLARKKALYAQEGFSLETVLGRLSNAYANCSVFAIDNGSSSFVGATPESLVSLENGALSLRCLAGTMARGDSPEEEQAFAKELFNSPKERLEHATVVDMLADSLKDVCTELRWDADPGVVQLKDVQHLATSFSGRIDGSSDILQLVKLLHPTPALGGTPTKRAMETIRRLEGDRGWYGAPLGWLDQHGEGEFSVAIRSALLRGNQATLFAGAGIVKGSDPDREFQETELKFRPLIGALSQC